MPEIQPFNPEWASPPGHTIAEILEEQNLSVAKFARRIGKSSKYVSDLLQGQTRITVAVARQLQKVLGASVEFWMSRDFQYQENLERLKAINKSWINELPLSDMIKFNWLSPAPKYGEAEAACLDFFDVPNTSAWCEKYATLHEIIAFRTSPTFESNPAAEAAWIRQGEIEGSAIDCNLWNPKKFHKSLSEIRRLTRQKNPSIFIPELQKICAESGVAVVVVRTPDGCRASGATQFLTSDKALLLLSFRYLTDDHFWFTFFHESGHLLLHGEKSIFLEGDDTPSNIEEQEANDFAVKVLFPDELQSSLLNLNPDTKEILRFAIHAGISPGIVVGQLQHKKLFKYNQMNRLKKRYQWID